MFISDSLGVKDNRLTFGGIDTVALAEKYGTPLYVFDADRIKLNCRAFISAINEYYDGKGTAAFASKAFSCVASVKLVNDENMSLDTVSGGEIYTALKSGFPAEKIIFHGNNKSEDELAYAIENNVGRIVCDGIEELETINSLACDYGKKVKILLRITPGIDAHTHSFVRTGQIDSKFGVTLENGDAMKTIGKAFEFDNIELAGLHCHIGSQIFDTEPFIHTADVMVMFLDNIRKEYGVTFNELDLGGGFGIRYLESDPKIDFKEFIKLITEAVKNKCDELSYPLPYLIFEPGRCIVGEAGITLYTVGRIKEIEGVRNYVSVDGGMADNPRYALYNADYTVCIANKVNDERNYKATIAGKCCESGDLIQENCMIQQPERGDILAVFTTGAYNYSMSSNYNRLCKPPVVFISEGKTKVVVRRETYEDITRNDIEE